MTNEKEESHKNDIKNLVARASGILKRSMENGSDYCRIWYGQYVELLNRNNATVADYPVNSYVTFTEFFEGLKEAYPDLIMKIQDILISAGDNKYTNIEEIVIKMP